MSNESALPPKIISKVVGRYLTAADVAALPEEYRTHPVVVERTLPADWKEPSNHKRYHLAGHAWSSAIYLPDWQPNEHAWVNPIEWDDFVKEVGDKRVETNPFNGAVVIRQYVKGRVLLVSSSPDVPRQTLEVRKVDL